MEDWKKRHLELAEKLVFDNVEDYSIDYKAENIDHYEGDTFVEYVFKYTWQEWEDESCFNRVYINVTRNEDDDVDDIGVLPCERADEYESIEECKVSEDFGYSLFSDNIVFWRALLWKNI